MTSAEQKMAIFAYACIAAAGVVIVYRTLTQNDLDFPTNEEILDAIREGVNMGVNGSGANKMAGEDIPVPKPPSPPVTPPGEAPKL